MKNLIIAYERGHHRINAMKKAIESLGQTVDVKTDSFDTIEGSYDRIWTLSESLLPIQAQLEAKLGLKNLSVSASEVLIDKKKFDDFCIAIGLGDMIPKSVIPTCKEDLLDLTDGDLIVKPTVGSGTKLDGFSYTSYHSKEELLNNAPDDFFEINKNGFTSPEFNNVQSYYMVQEMLPTYAKLYAYYAYIDMDGNVHKQFPVRLDTNIIRDGNSKYYNHPYIVESIEEDEVPEIVKESTEIFYESTADVLGVRNMFISGPDFYVYDGITKMIDCNPRIGTGTTLMDKAMGFTVIPDIIANKKVQYNKHFLWRHAALKPGVVKSVKDYSHLKKYISETSHELCEGTVITEQTNVSDNLFNMSIVITGTKRPDMHKTYQAVKEELQNCIEYY